ncbi:ddx42 [Symbiodinium sp. KB8]|nr:ddx42 [Symbiodinium sp. KB8]
MTNEQIAQARVDLRVSATGSQIVAPVTSFAHLAHVLGREIMEGIRRHGYQQPTAIQELREEQESMKGTFGQVLVLFSGDAFGGSTWSTLKAGAQMPKALNMAGVDIACPGNHEFDFGFSEGGRLFEACSFPWVLSNLGNLARDKQLPLRSHILKDVGGLRIGFFGLMDQNAAQLFEGGHQYFQDFVDRGKDMVKILRELGAEIVIALTHMDMISDERLSQEVQGIDLILGGHDHMICPRVGTSIRGPGEVLKSGSDFEGFSKITYVSGRWCSEFRRVSKSGGQDQAAAKFESEVYQSIRPQLQRRVLQSDVVLDCREATVRSRESNVGNFIADSILQSCRSKIRCDAAFINGGMMRGNRTYKGVLTQEDVLGMVAYQDSLCVLDMRGEELLETLEHSVSQLPARKGCFLHVSGLRFEFDPSQDPGARVDKGSIRIGDDLRPVSDDEVYRCVTREWLRSSGGMDGFKSLARATVVVAATQALMQEGLVLPSLLIKDEVYRVHRLNPGSWRACGRVLKTAETGSGKTVAYLLPMPELQKDDGPIGDGPSVQIETETFKFNKQLGGMRSVTLAGGLSKLEQFKEVKRVESQLLFETFAGALLRGAEIAICNPGRLIDVVKPKPQTEHLEVLDEADRMFHMGFEYQVRSIVSDSASWPDSIADYLGDSLEGKFPTEQVTIEEKFETDFSEYIKERSSWRSWKLGAVGAAMGGALGVAASPLVVPGLALAALVGGAGGYQWARYWGSQELQHETGHHPEGDTQLPTLRRLKFMVRWSQWQLKAYETASVEARMAVLDEVTRAFAPWIQRLYLLRAQPEPWMVEADVAEVQESLTAMLRVSGQYTSQDAPSTLRDSARSRKEHLAPLFFLLHRRLVVETIELGPKGAAASALGKDFDQCTVAAWLMVLAQTGPGLGEVSSGIPSDPCDASGPAGKTEGRKNINPHAVMKSNLQVSQASAKLLLDCTGQATFNDQRVHRRRRLQFIVAAVCQVLERADVKQSLEDPKFWAHLQIRPAPTFPSAAAIAHSTSDDETVSSRASSPALQSATARRGVTPLELPPHGAEDEVAGENDEAFFSLSDNSDDETARRRPKAARSRVKAPRRSFRQRSELCPRGHLPNSWNRGDCRHWRIRSETYFRDRRKLPCAETMLELVNCDWVAIGEDGPVTRVSTHPDFYPACARKDGDKRFLLVTNFVLGDYQAIMTMALNPDAAWVSDDSSPQSRVWRSFLHGDDDTRRQRVKLILAVEEGPWLVKKAFIKKPMLICKLLQCKFHHEPNDYLEIAFERATGATVGVVLKSMRGAVLSCALLLEAKEPDELPEHLLATAVANYVDPAKFCDILQQPVRITIGEAAANVQQFVEVLKNDDEKWAWLSKRVDGMLQKGQLLVFVKSIASAEELSQNFQDFLEKKTEFLHGDLDQGERMRILRNVRKRHFAGKNPGLAYTRVVDVLIATDVAARGLDLPSIATVVSYDAARDIETHTHRIGRTGRAGAAGEAYTLLTGDDQNKKMAALLVENLEQANQAVPEDLKGLAMKHGPFRAAKLEGRTFLGKKKGAGKVEKSAFGLGFDGASRQKETVQDLAKRLDKEADQLAALNRQKISGGMRAGPNRMMMKSGFVAAAVAEAPKGAGSEGPKKDEDSSDEDLFAPGVTSAFGRPAKAKAPAPPPTRSGLGFTFPPQPPQLGQTGQVQPPQVSPQPLPQVGAAAMLAMSALQRSTSPPRGFSDAPRGFSDGPLAADSAQ